MILSRDGREFYEIEDLALLWGAPFARHVWDLIIVGNRSDLGLNQRTSEVGHLPTGTTTTDYTALVPASTWPAVLSAAVRIADKEGVR